MAEDPGKEGNFVKIGLKCLPSVCPHAERDDSNQS